MGLSRGCLLLVAVIGGCAPARPQAPVLTGETAVAQRGPKLDEGRTVAPAAAPQRDPYTVAVDVPDSAVVGKESVASIGVVLDPPWHINMDFPTTLKLTGPADAPTAQPQLGRDHARRLDADHADFDVYFTASSAGDKHFEGELRFAVCRPESCVPVTAPVVFVVAVTDGTPTAP